MDFLNDHDWEKMGRTFKNAQPFPSICIDNFLNKNFINELASSYPEYSQAKVIGHEFQTVNEKRKTQITDPAIFPEPMTRLCEVLASEDFIQKLSNMTGIKNLKWDPLFTGGGMHLTGPTGILDVHVDFNYEKKLDLYRRLNILIYLNPIWEKFWGGEVELWDRDVKKCIHSFEPVLNRCVLFETSDYSFHGVTAVKCPDGMTRNSFAAYYYTTEAGNNAGLAYGGTHDTIFRARPSEIKKKYFLMPLSKLRAKNREHWEGLKSTIRKL